MSLLTMLRELRGPLASYNQAGQLSREELKKVVKTLDFLNTDAVFSEDVRVLRETLANGMKGVKYTPPALIEVSENPPDEKTGNVETVKYFIGYVSHLLNKVHWSPLLREALGPMRRDAEPFAERPGEALQIVQIKQLLNGLYHLELGLQAIESEHLTTLLKAYLLVEDSLGVVDAANHERLAAAAEERAVTEVPGGTYWQQGYGLASNVASHFYNMGWSTLHPSNWPVTVAARLAYQTHQIVEHIYRACDLITHIDPEFLGALRPEWEAIASLLNTERLDGDNIKTFIAKQNLDGWVRKAGILPSTAMDQFRPNEDGGMDFPLVAALATKTGEVLQNTTDHIEDYFRDSELVLSKARAFAVQAGMRPHVIAKFGNLIATEVKARPEEERARLKQLGEIATDLTKSVSHIQEGGVLSFVHYTAVAWYGWDLISSLLQRATSLDEAGREALKEIVRELRDKYGASLAGLADKFEEVFTLEAGELTKKYIEKIEPLYDDMLKKSASVVDLSELGPFQSDAFREKRLAMAEKRRAAYKKELAHIEKVLEPALDVVVGRARAPGEDPDALPKLLELLKPYIEHVDARHGMAHQPLEAKYEAIKQRLSSLKQTKVLAIELTDHVIEQSIYPFELKSRRHLRMLSRWQRLTARLYDTNPSLETVLAARETSSRIEVDEAALSETERKASARETLRKERLQAGYLITDTAEGSTIDTIQTVCQGANALISNYGIDPNGDKDSPLSLHHVAATLTSLDASFVSLKDLRVGGSSIPYISKVNYVAETIGLFSAWGDAATSIVPFGTTFYSVVSARGNRMLMRLNAEAVHYELPYEMKNAGWAYGFMHATQIAPAHLKALSEGRLTPLTPERREGESDIEHEARVKAFKMKQKLMLPKETRDEATNAATTFSDEASRIYQHADQAWWARYPLLSYDVVRILFWRIFTNQTIDQQLLNAIKTLSSSSYDALIDGGLEGINHYVFHELMRAAYDFERALTMPPGLIALRLEKHIDIFMKGALEPLSMPSDKYYQIRVNERSYRKHDNEFPSGSSHHAWYHARLEETLKARKAVVREETIDRVFNLELLRIQRSQGFNLEHAGKLYINDLRRTVRPALQKLISDDETQFEQPVFDVLYTEELPDLSIFDDPKREGFEQKGSCRLDAMEAELDVLEAYLKAEYADSHSWSFNLFEDKATHEEKSAWLEMLRSIARDRERAPSARIATLRELISTSELQNAMNNRSDWLSFAGMGRGFVWLFSCVGLCESRAPSQVVLDELLRIADPVTKELQVFDAFYAKDYRRLDAMLKQVLTVEAYLKATYEETHRWDFDLFESEETHEKKLHWIKTLRELAENGKHTPRERIDAMREWMSNPEFKEDMLAYHEREFFIYKPVKQSVLWLLSCVGLYSFPCTNEYNAMLAAKTFAEAEAELNKLIAYVQNSFEEAKKIHPDAYDMFENEETHRTKTDRINQLSEALYDEELEEAERLEAVRELLSNERFKQGMLKYAPQEFIIWAPLKQRILWFLSCVGLYNMPCVAEEKALQYAADEATVYDKTPLIQVSLFSEPVSPKERGYTVESFAEEFGLGAAV